MNKKTIIKYIYFTILLLLPFAPNLFNARWGLIGIPASFGDVMLFLFLMSINFIVAFKLYKIHKRKSIARSAFLILLAFIVIIFLADASGMGEGMMVLFYPIGMIIPFNPLYFFGILIYDRFIDKEHKAEDDNISK